MKAASNSPRSQKPARSARVRERSKIKIADEVWIATALLHREHPERADFTTDEIVDRVRQEAISGELRPGVRVYVLLHSVANRPPNPARYRGLFEPEPGRRRLFRRGDACHRGRDEGRITPLAEQIPAEYTELLRWYEEWSAAQAAKSSEPDPLLALRGTGTALWADEHADEYVRRLRQDWE